MLITPIEVIKKGSFDHNFDPNLVCPHISKVEFRFLEDEQSCFGKAFFDFIVGKLVEYTDYDSTVTYAINTVVIYDGKYYKCKANGTIGFPPSNATKWDPVTKFTDADIQKLWDDHLWEYLALAVQHASTFKNAYRTTSKGIMRNETDNSKPAEFSGVKSLKDELMADVELLGRKMDAFLRANKDKYPLYKGNATCGNECEKKPSSIGLYLKSKRRDA